MLHTSSTAHLHPSLHHHGGGGGGGVGPTAATATTAANHYLDDNNGAGVDDPGFKGMAATTTTAAPNGPNPTTAIVGHYAASAGDASGALAGLGGGVRRHHHHHHNHVTPRSTAVGTGATTTTPTTSTPAGGDRKLAFGQLRQAVSCQLCDLLDEAHINATRVVSGRRFVRWDTVPKLLAQQNVYIGGLPYDFFFSKSVLTLGRVPNTGASAIGNSSGGVRHQTTGLGPTETSYNLPNTNPGLVGNSGAIAATAADRDGERHLRSLLRHPPEEAVVVEEDELVDDNEEDEEDEEEDVDGDDELDGSSSSNNEVTTPPSSGSPGASGATTISRAGTTPASPPLSSSTVIPAPDFLLPPGNSVGGGAVHNSPHHHRTHDYPLPHSSKSTSGRFAPQQSNQPITSLSASIPAVAGGVVTGVAAEAHIPISSLDAASIVAILHAQPLNINILSWKKQTIEEILALLRQGKIRVAPRPQGRDVVFELVMPNGNTVDVPKWPDVFPSAAAAMVMANISSTQSSHHHHHHHTERVAFPSSMSPALDGAFDASGNEGPPLRDGGGVIRTSRADREKRRGISAGPASSSAYERTRTMSGGGGGGPYGAPSSNTSNPSGSGANGLALKLRMDGRAATPSSSGVASPDRESTFPYSQRGRRLTSIKGEGSEEQDGSSGDRMVHHYTLTPSSFHPYQPSMGKMQVVTGGGGERAMSDEMLSPSSGAGMMMAEDPPTRGRSTFTSAAAAAAAAGAFLTTPTPTKKWTRRSSPDRIYMNVTLNSILRGAGMPIPRQKDDASRLPWSSIPQFLAEKQMYITGWPEANLPWLYSGDEPKGANGSPSKGGPKLPNGSMGEWKDRIDWKSSPSQRSYKPLAQALRNGEIKILPRPKGRDVIFEVKDTQGRLYDTTLGLSEEWKRKWMYSGEKHQQPLVYPRQERRASFVASALVDMEEDSKAESMSVDEDVEQKRAVYRSHHPRRSFDMHHDTYDKFSPERSTPSSFGRASPVPAHTMRRMSYPFPPISSAYPSPYGQHGSYSRHTTDTSSYDGPSRYLSSSHGLDERYSLGPREYVESTARYQQPPESSLRDSNDASMREGRPNSAPKEFEEEVTSPGSSRQRTTSLGTSSAASGTVLSPGQQHTSKMGYTLPPLSQSTAMDIDMDDPKVNKLPPIRALMYDSDDDRARPLHSHHLNLPQLSASTTSLSSSGIPATPNNPYLSTTPPRSQLGYNSSSPRMSVDRRDPSPPETNTNNVPTHFPKPTSAFSQPYWDAKEHVWRLNVQDSESAALPPVGNKVCWDARSGKWRVAYHAHLADTNSGFPVAFWSHDTEAWVLSSSA